MVAHIGGEDGMTAELLLKVLLEEGHEAKVFRGVGGGEAGAGSSRKRGGEFSCHGERVHEVK
jgi:hypothetical protein